MSAGVYVIRTRKPNARFRIPFLSTHFGYVGESVSMSHRVAQHIVGGGAYQAVPKDWADLVVSVHRIPLPRFKPLLHLVETMVILAVWPVYNVAKNQWNPRRISPGHARMHRRDRDRGHRGIVLWPFAVALVLLVLAVLLIGDVR